VLVLNVDNPDDDDVDPGLVDDTNEVDPEETLDETVDELVDDSELAEIVETLELDKVPI